MKSKFCGNCGSKKIGKREVFGPFRYRDFPAVVLKTPVLLHQCEDCGERMGTLEDSKVLDASIEADIKEQVRAFIERIVTRESIEQKELAKAVGISPEYLSLIKSGAKIPAFQLFSFLKVLSLSRESFGYADPGLYRTEHKAEVTVFEISKAVVSGVVRGESARDLKVYLEGVEGLADFMRKSRRTEKPKLDPKVIYRTDRKWMT